MKGGNMKTLIIGDIHGKITKLKALVEKAGAVDEIISVGDLIDRGEDSKAVIEFCIAQGIKVCKGNHELMAQEVLETYDPTKPFSKIYLQGSDWFNNGGAKVWEQFKNDREFLLDYIKAMPTFIKTSHTINDLPVIVSHTCLNIYQQDFTNLEPNELIKHEEVMLWTRAQPNKTVKPYFFSIYGHTPTDYLGVKEAQPIIANFGINLDTGACYNTKDRGRLTGIILPTMEIIQV